MTKSNEGLEGTVVNIYGGDISIVSSDDAVNAANSDGLYEGVLDYAFNMLGGKLVRSNKKQKHGAVSGGFPGAAPCFFYDSGWTDKKACPAVIAHIPGLW